MGVFRRILQMFQGRRNHEYIDITQRVSSTEVNALIRYASERGIDPAFNSQERSTLTLLSQAMNKYEANNKDRDGEETSKLEAEVLELYSHLIKASNTDGFEINGRTLLETRKANQHIWDLILLTVLLLSVAIANEMLGSWLSEQPTPEEGWHLWLSDAHEHLLLHLMPFIWGGLGSCVYLLKALYDYAQHRAFDSTRLHGLYLRVVLGAVLAAVVLYLFDPALFSEDHLPLDYKAVAFLVGLSVKLVYGALEKLVHVLVEKFDLGSLRRGKSEVNPVFSFLNEELADPLSVEDPKRKEVIADLLQRYGQKFS